MHEASKKTFILLGGFIAVFAVYMLFLPSIDNGYSVGAALHFAMILYASLSTLALYNLSFRSVAKNNIALACLLGFLSMAVIIPIENGRISFSIPGFNLTNVVTIGIITSITVALVFLWSVSLMAQFENKKEIIKKISAGNVIIYFSILFAFIIGFWILTGFKIPVNKISLANVLQSMSTGVSEEVIFRLLPYAFVLSLSKEKSPSKILVFLFMTVPFTMVHFLRADTFFHNLTGFLGSFIVWVVPVTIIFLRRDLITAISVHCLYTILLYVFRG